MKKLVPLALIVAAAIYAVVPFLINAAPEEATMGLIYKIIFFHVPSAMMMFISACVCGVASAMVVFKRSEQADHIAAAAAELAIVFGAIVLVTGPLWARKAWGIWWEWDPRLTSTLVMWLVFCAFLMLRKFGGPGSESLSAAVGLFGMALVPFVYWSVNVWRGMHPRTTVIPTLPETMLWPFWLSVLAFLCLYSAILAVRVRLEGARAEFEHLMLAAED
jgi:heme exporter protein C